MRARFNRTQHAIVEGWATYWSRDNLPGGWRGLVCLLIGHALPGYAPTPLNGYAPSNYSRCRRCEAPVKWFVRGQHRHGSLSA